MSLMKGLVFKAERQKEERREGAQKKKSERLSVWLFWQTAEARRQQKLCFCDTDTQKFCTTMFVLARAHMRKQNSTHKCMQDNDTYTQIHCP